LESVINILFFAENVDLIQAIVGYKTSKQIEFYFNMIVVMTLKHRYLVVYVNNCIFFI